MPFRITFAMLVLLMCCGVSHARDGRWNNFAEDNELKYYLDQKSITSLPDNVYIFWVKSVAKDKDYFKREFNKSNLSYMLTNYELDCAVSSYRIRGIIMFDKNRREISKSLPESEPAFEPVPPESVLELAQDEICTKEGARGTSEVKEQPVATPAAPAQSGAPVAPAAATHASSETPASSEEPASVEEPVSVEEPASVEEPVSVEEPASAEMPASPKMPASSEPPEIPVVPTAPAAPEEPPVIQ